MTAPEPPDRVAALRAAAGAADEELAMLRAVIEHLRAIDTTDDVVIDPEASWRRIEAWLDRE